MTDNENVNPNELTGAEAEELRKLLKLAAEVTGGRFAASGNVTTDPESGQAAIAMSVYRDRDNDREPEIGVINFAGKGRSRPTTVADMLDLITSLVTSSQQVFADMAGIEYPLGEPAGLKDLRNIAAWFRAHPKLDAQVMRYLDRELSREIVDTAVDKILDG